MNKYVLFLTASFIAGLVLLLNIGDQLSASANRIVKAPPVEVESVVHKGTHGWFLGADRGKTCALLLHGIRADRTSMLARARYLESRGISSLLIDMQAHGETQGERITFGYLESRDATNGVDYLRKNKGCAKILAIGQSLGGAAALLGSSPLQVDALVLESVYPTIEEAVADRLEARLGAGSRVLSPLLYYQIPLRIGISLDKLRPIDAVRQVTYPLLIMGGSGDPYTKVEETKKLYESARTNKSLWIVEGAAHVDLHRYAKSAYEKTLNEFITKNLD